MKTQAAMRTRAGFSILELGIAVALSSLLMALVVTLFSAVLKAQRQTLARERERREFARLDELLRSDVHAAREVEMKSPTECELLGEAKRRWVYRFSESKLLRETYQADQLKQRETFSFQRGQELTFRQEPAGTRTIVQVKIAAKDQAPHESRWPTYRGEAVLGGGLAWAGKDSQP